MHRANLIVAHVLGFLCIDIETNVTCSSLKAVKQGLHISYGVGHECQIVGIIYIYDSDSRVSMASCFS